MAAIAGAAALWSLLKWMGLMYMGSQIIKDAPDLYASATGGDTQAMKQAKLAAGAMTKQSEAGRAGQAKMMEFLQGRETEAKEMQMFQQMSEAQAPLANLGQTQPVQFQPPMFQQAQTPPFSLSGLLNI